MVKGKLGIGAREFADAYELFPEQALPFLKHDTDAGRERLLSFARAHPWLMPYAASDEETGVCRPIVLANPDQDRAAAAIMATTGADDAEDFLPIVRRLRNFGQPEFLAGPDIVHDVAMARLVPGDLWPAPVPAGASLLDPAQQTMMSFLPCASFIARLAGYAGRDVSDVLGRFDGWGPYLERLRRRADLPPSDREYASGAWYLASDVVATVSDMICAFETEVVRPAVFRIEPGFVDAEGPVRHDVSEQDDNMSFFGMAVRLLLRDGTFPRLVETAREWHGKAPAIARRCAEAAGDRMRAGPKLFERMELLDGTHVVCLNEPHALLSEGLDGPDEDGRPGLAHCVGSYVEKVANAETFILGVRAPDPKMGWRRVSTVELDRLEDGHAVPRVVQHRGKSNAIVPALERIALGNALPAIADRMRELQRLPEGGADAFDWAPILADPGAWEGARDAWAFAIERGRRTLGHEEFLDGVWDESLESVMRGRRP